MAVAAGWLVQLLLTYQQSVAFSRALKQLRPFGRVAVGRGGRRYRGGRAFVAIAVDERDVVAKAQVLRGWTTFARPRGFEALEGHHVSVVAGTQRIPGVLDKERAAVREAAGFLPIGHVNDDNAS
jgi:DNA-binding transcriptional regulator of glucitol operon